MTDTTKALRHAATMCEGDYLPTGTGEAPVSDLLLGAADTIERLRKDLAYWERIGRDKLDVELMRGMAADNNGQQK